MHGRANPEMCGFSRNGTPRTTEATEKGDGQGPTLTMMGIAPTLRSRRAIIGAEGGGQRELDHTLVCETLAEAEVEARKGTPAKETCAPGRRIPRGSLD